MRFRFVLLSLTAAASAVAGPVNVDPDMPLPKELSAFNLFADSAAQTPHEGVIAYDLSTPLFTDHALKNRFLWMPGGTSAAYHETDAFDFPVGTVIAKTFSYPADFRQPEENLRRIETRILWRKAKGWVALPYVWNEDASEAKLAVAGKQTEVRFLDENGAERTVNYIVPNMNQCKLCHENQKEIGPIGPKARYLNREYLYDGEKKNQLVKLMEAGYLRGAPEDPAAWPHAFDWTDSSAPLEDRARTYLDINCAHCHNPKGPAYTSGLDLTFYQKAPHRIGVYKPPVAAGRGSAGLRFGIVPGAPEESILLARMLSLDPGMMMPQLGRTTVHEEGVALVEEWIRSLRPADFHDLLENPPPADPAPEAMAAADSTPTP